MRGISGFCSANRNLPSLGVYEERAIIFLNFYREVF